MIINKKKPITQLLLLYSSVINCAEEEVKVINVSEISDLQSCHLGELPSNCVFCYRFIKEDIRTQPASRVQELGENKVDYLRSAVPRRFSQPGNLLCLR